MKKENLKQSKGITLISLVITIIVLLILAAVSIGLLLGENGILTRAEESSVETGEAEAREKIKLAILASYDETGKINTTALENELKKYTEKEVNIGSDEVVGNINGYVFSIKLDGLVILINGKSEDIGNNDNTGGTTIPDIESAKTVLSETEKTVIQDEFKNYVTIPAGFKVAEDSGTDVTKGIVVEDSNGNQFVWIPVGEIKTDNSGGKVTIELSRYEFSSDGTAVKKGNTDIVATYFIENKVNLDDFMEKTKASKGYYVARYEASVSNGKVASKANQMPWVNITQSNAAKAAKAMYENTEYTSDIINSLAWDTALIFIQTFSEDKDYSRQRSLNGSVQATGTTSDQKLKIYDMASNVSEWTTENSTILGYNFVYRGGNAISAHFTAFRAYCLANLSSDNISFRPILFL